MLVIAVSIPNYISLLQHFRLPSQEEYDVDVALEFGSLP